METKQPAEPFQEHSEVVDQRDEERVNALKIGEYVKIKTGGERFWVCVTTIEGDAIYGNVTSITRFMERHGLKRDDLVQFEKKHILEIES